MASCMRACHAGSQCTRQQQHVPGQQGSVQALQRRLLRPLQPLQLCAYQSSQASDALQQHRHAQQEASATASEASPSASLANHDEELRQHIEQDYDLDLWHYQPWWLKPPVIIAAGLGFLAVSLLLDDEPTTKTFVLAAGPVVLFWGLFLFLLPRQFKSFAVDYIEMHPEVEEQAALELHDQLEQQEQQQQQQQQ